MAWTVPLLTRASVPSPRSRSAEVRVWGLGRGGGGLCGRRLAGGTAGRSCPLPRSPRPVRGPHRMPGALLRRYGPAGRRRRGPGQGGPRRLRPRSRPRLPGAVLSEPHDPVGELRRRGDEVGVVVRERFDAGRGASEAQRGASAAADEAAVLVECGEHRAVVGIRQGVRQPPLRQGVPVGRVDQPQAAPLTQRYAAAPGQRLGSDHGRRGPPQRSSVGQPERGQRCVAAPSAGQHGVSGDDRRPAVPGRCHPPDPAAGCEPQAAVVPDEPLVP